MKVLISILFVFGVVLSQAEHPMLGRPDHFRPQGEEPKAHPSEEDALRVHPHPSSNPEASHPMLGQNDGHDNLQGHGEPFPQPGFEQNYPMPGQNHGRHGHKGKHHHRGGHKGEHRGGNRHHPAPSVPFDQLGHPIEMNTDASGLRQDHPMLGQAVAPMMTVVSSEAPIDGNQMTIDNPTKPTQPWNQEEGDYEGDFEEEDRPRHHPPKHCRWGRIIIPIIGLILIGFLIKKCCKRCCQNRRRWHERMRQQMMQNMNAPAVPIELTQIVPIQRNLHDQLAYHRQEAQRIEMMLLQEHQQQMQPLNEPSFEPVYGRPMQPRY